MAEVTRDTCIAEYMNAPWWRKLFGSLNPQQWDTSDYYYDIWSKSSWPTIAPGDSVSVVLPGGEDPELSLTFRQAGRPGDWRGSRHAKGVRQAVA